MAIREQTQARGDEVVDLAGNYLAPGFIDLHVHGALGRDSMEASAEAFRAICDFHAKGGTTSLLLTTATAPLETLGGVLRAVRDCIGGAPGGRALPGRLQAFMWKAPSSQKQNAARNVRNSFRNRHRLMCSSCSPSQM